MSLTLFAQNLLESAASVTVTPAAAATKPIARIYDRDRGPQYEGGSAAQTDIDVDLGASPLPVTGWALVNHTFSGVTVTLFGENSTPPTISRDSFAAVGADTLRTIASLTLRYWRIRIPAMASAPKVGELLVGAPRVIGLNPALRSAGRGTLANVTRDRSPGGYGWAVRRGAKRTRLPYAWAGLPDADRVLLEAAYADVQEGAKNLLLQDELGTLRWVEWLTTELQPVPIGAQQSELAGVVFEEAL